VKRDCGIPPRLVFHCRVEPHEELPPHRGTGRSQSFGESNADVRGTHPLLAGVGVVDGDDRHGSLSGVRGQTGFVAQVAMVGEAGSVALPANRYLIVSARASAKPPAGAGLSGSRRHNVYMLRAA